MGSVETLGADLGGSFGSLWTGSPADRTATTSCWRVSDGPIVKAIAIDMANATSATHAIGRRRTAQMYAVPSPSSPEPVVEKKLATSVLVSSPSAKGCSWLASFPHKN
jgi:hypothetical protein